MNDLNERSVCKIRFLKEIIDFVFLNLLIYHAIFTIQARAYFENLFVFFL